MKPTNSARLISHAIEQNQRLKREVKKAVNPIERDKLQRRIASNNIIAESWKK